jgi:hypothetical protein
MKRNKFGRTSKDQQISQAEDQIADDELYDDAINKTTADYYERSWKGRVKDRQLDIWIAVGLYVILSSVAFVAL